MEPVLYACQPLVWVDSNTEPSTMCVVETRLSLRILVKNKMWGKLSCGPPRPAHPQKPLIASFVPITEINMASAASTGVGAGSAAAGTSGPAGGSSEDIIPPHLARDPEPFECPYSACAYDCQKRAPVRVPCACKRLVCRKCAGVAGQQPSGCGVCGAPGVEYTPADCTMDAGTLLALAAGIPDPEPYV
jgi:hypothetical protein